ncbi:MAG TPA: FAD-dependent oxidoreductase, partial [Gammaproteobacteria bacterium]|nr:FAD-dependent oxidoreductase [Gammaproteobacteria bacterium]
MSVLPGSLRDAPRYDVIVIGGGINGAAIAREAALSGLSVALFERDDLCSGTSAASTRLIHGGLRYLEHAEFGLVYESLHERERLLQTAGHLVAPIPFYIPVYAGAQRRRWEIALGMSLYDILSIGKSAPRHRMLSAAQMQHALPGLRARGLRGGACYYDAQVTFPERLVVELAADAAASGAVIRTHCPVGQIITEGDAAVGIEY